MAARTRRATRPRHWAVDAVAHHHELVAAEAADGVPGRSTPWICWATWMRAWWPAEWSGVSLIVLNPSMNGCDDQRFLVRWNAAGSAARIGAGLADTAGSVSDVVTDSSGWTAFDGCQTPEFRSHANTNELIDLAVSVQQ